MFTAPNHTYLDDTVQNFLVDNANPHVYYHLFCYAGEPDSQA